MIQNSHQTNLVLTLHFGEGEYIGKIFVSKISGYLICTYGIGEKNQHLNKQYYPEYVPLDSDRKAKK